MNAQDKRPAYRCLLVLGCLLASSARAAPGETVEVYSAGSLRGVVGALSREAQSRWNLEVKPTFGGSGLLRERIEKGERPDLFLSADLASPLKLEQQGRTVVPAIAIAANRMCIVSRRELKVTAENLIDRLLAKGVRIRTSTPVADPSGDYAWAIFDRIERLRPGAGATLKEKAQASMSLPMKPAAPEQNPMAALFNSHQVDVAITYCSGTAALLKDAPDVGSLEVPAALDPHPIDGMAVLSDKPAVLRLALWLLSEKGQAAVAEQGLVPLREAKPAPQ
jgi:molybdate transport system substrate-binding protein